MPLARFHPAVAHWFERTFGEPTPCQSAAWPLIEHGRPVLVAAPTGSGKTLAAFLGAIDELVRAAAQAPLPDATWCLYVSPLRALSNDIARNLEAPLAGIEAALADRGLAPAGIRTAVRTGDTPAAARAAMRRRPPHILVTTPESLYILLTSASGREMLAGVRRVIVDEIHALAGNKRGAHLALSLERLEALTARPPVRIGLSATQRPLSAIARFLAGAGPEPMVVDEGHRREWDLDVVVPDSPLEPVMAAEVWGEVYDRLAALIGQHRTTLVFVNTRRLAERVARHLSERLGDDAVTSHHGSLSREQRLDAEQRLKNGRLRALVATASLELGIDIGDVDLACQLGSPRAIATALQRIGRAGHGVGRIPVGRLFPLSRDDLVECLALLDAVRAGELDRIRIPGAPLDVLAQQIVATVATGEWDEDALYALVTRAGPYQALPRERFDAVVRMLAEGFSTRRGRRGAWLHRDAVNRRLRARRGARLTAVTCGGAIPDTAEYEVRAAPDDRFVGMVDEDFAVESLAGDIFQLGNTSWRVQRVEAGVVRVEDAHGQPPTIPFWLGEAPGRTAELSAAVSGLRADVGRALDEGGQPGAMDWLRQRLGVGVEVAGQAVAYLAAGRAALGAMPTQQTLAMERFFDESGGMQLVIHAPFGTRINRAWGLALRKRFCRQFNFELQAAATDDAIVLSLGETHSFALEEVWRYLHPASVRQVLVQALLDAPMFTVRWRWVAATALAIRRFEGGHRVPARLLRMRAEDLAGVLFPDQRACFENIRGEREVPDHPLVWQAIDDCLTEAMDVAGLEALLADIHAGRRRLVAADLTEPSPMAREVLAARPWAFLDDAPLEERRTQAVAARRYVDAGTAADLGRLDPAAIAQVRAEAWPECADADELHDALMTAGFLTMTEVERGGWAGWRDGLTGAGRATVAHCGAASPLVVATERLPELLAALPQVQVAVPVEVPAEYRRDIEPRAALVELVRGRLEVLGPVTTAAVADSLGLPVAAADRALLALESEGFALRGRFEPDAGEQWCERRLLARIHRRTVNRLRAEIEPVDAASLLRFLIDWQHVAPDSRLEGAEGLAAVVAQLGGVEAPAALWESELLPARVRGYNPAWLDALCLAGRVVWGRRARDGEGGVPALRAAPVTLAGRRDEALWDIGPVAGVEALDAAARRLWQRLCDAGPAFFEELVDTTGLLRAQVEDGLSQLAAAGLARSDAFAGLRALAVGRNGRGRRRTRGLAVVQAGRWSAVSRRPAADGREERAMALARALAGRYGVVFRRLLERESGLPPWRDLARALRRLEARGELRGGRFVAGFTGEQFALPEAVTPLRRARRDPAAGRIVSVCAADPLNLVGVITPGARIPARAGNRVVYRDGVPVAVQIGNELRLVARLDARTAGAVRAALGGRQHAPRRHARRHPLPSA